MTGFTEQEVLTQKALSHGIRPESIMDACVTHQLRIENALLLHSFCEWIKEHRLQQTPSAAKLALIRKAVNRRLLGIISERIKCSDEVLAAMCIKHNWKTFAASVECKRSWEEVSEMDTSFMMRIRATE